MSKTMYLPWLRRGLAGFLPAPSGSSQPADPVLPVKVALTRDGATEATHTHEIALRGPGHVVALDPGVLLREEPPRQAQKITPTTFPHVELREADLPWRHSPVGAKDGRVPPWIVLVCVEQQEGVRLARDRERRCWVLHIEGALVQTELPDLTESWAWAHVQISGLADPDKDGPLGDRAKPREHTIARLVCPRRLRPFRRYLCALVPAFQAGVEAALGQAPTTTDLKPAWTKATRDALALPVFHSWGFSTGEDGDFETLVSRLQPRAASSGLGERPLHLSPSAAVNIAADAPPALLRGALRAPVDGKPVESYTPPDVARGLASLWEVQAGDGDEDPLVLPPLYGAGHIGTERPEWLAQLNCHPGHRVNAGLGAEVVLRHQEELVAASWDQLEQARAAAVALRRAQVAAEIARTQAQRVAALTPGDALQLTSRAHARMVAADGTTVRARLLAEGVPDGVLAPRMRRLTRGGSAVARGRTAAKGTLAGSLAARLLQGPQTVLRAAAWVRPDGVNVSKTAAAKATPAATPAAAKPFTLHLRPLDNHVARLRSRLTGDATPKFSAEDGLPDALRLMPRFDVPLSRWLVDIDPEVVLPGLGEVPDDTVMLLQPNRAFIEAVLAGANDALARELAWREFPVDPRGTAFRVFWDGADGVDALELRAWARQMGQHAAPAKEGNAANAAVLLRGELFRRYPDLVVYVGRQVGSEVKTQAPTCFGWLTNDTCYALFAETPEALRKDWWIVFEEVPGAPRFGLDGPREKAGGVPEDADAVSWSHFATDPAMVEALTHAPARKPAFWNNAKELVRDWGTHSAAIARLTLQRPIRCAVRLSALLPSPGDA